MRAFLTGSRVYGKPHANSDTDLVLFLPQAQFEILRSQSDEPTVTGRSLRFGKLNLICPPTNGQYWAWKEVTDDICRDVKLGMEVTRAEAIKRFKAAGTDGKGNSCSTDYGASRVPALMDVIPQC